MRTYAIAGLSGAGKTTVLRAAGDRGCATASVGDVVRESYRQQGFSGSVGEFVTTVHRRHGRDWFARRAAERLRDREPPSAAAVVDGVHSRASVRALRETLGPVGGVWVDAPGPVRLRRLRGREDGIAGPEALLRRDLRELNAGLAALARPLGHDYHLDNGTDDVARLHRRLDCVLG